MTSIEPTKNVSKFPKDNKYKKTIQQAINCKLEQLKYQVLEPSLGAGPSKACTTSSDRYEDLCHDLDWDMIISGLLLLSEKEK